LIAGPADLVGLPLHVPGLLARPDASGVAPHGVAGVPVDRSSVVLRASDARAINATSRSIDLRAGPFPRVATRPAISEFASVPVVTIRGRAGTANPLLAVAGVGHLRQTAEQRLSHPGRHSIEPGRDGSLLFGREAASPRHIGRCGRSYGRPCDRRFVDVDRRGTRGDDVGR
jgi:hypothetical protein